MAGNAEASKANTAKNGVKGANDQNTPDIQVPGYFRYSRIDDKLLGPQ